MLLRQWVVVAGMLVGVSAWGQAGSTLRVGPVEVLAPAVVSAVAPEATVGEALRSLRERASDVFVGQVVAIERKGGVVEVRFRVDQSVVGTQGGEFVLREWAGLWPVGKERYSVGERAMVFVRAAGASGLSSPVDGADGMVPVVVQQNGAAPLLDVERLQARVLRAHGEALGQADVSAMRLQDVVALVAAGPGVVLREPRRLPMPVRVRVERGVPFLAGGRVMWPVEVLDAR